MLYQPRTYRNRIRKPGLSAFQVVVKETDLHIQADQELKDHALERVLYHRGVLEKYIVRNPMFATTMAPWPGDEPKPNLVQEMITAGRLSGVGPMAAVAGAVAAKVGIDLLEHSKEVIVENGGDVFLSTIRPVTLGIHAGVSPLGESLAIRIGGGTPVGVCTSSGTIGHSYSYGNADAVCVISSVCALADAAATAICNRVQGELDIRGAIEWGKNIDGVLGIVIIIGEKMGAWGEVEFVPVKGKKG